MLLKSSCTEIPVAVSNPLFVTNILYTNQSPLLIVPVAFVCPIHSLIHVGYDIPPDQKYSVDDKILLSICTSQVSNTSICAVDIQPPLLTSTLYTPAHVAVYVEFVLPHGIHSYVDHANAPLTLSIVLCT
jgi:hypothetical protein